MTTWTVFFLQFGGGGSDFKWKREGLPIVKSYNIQAAYRTHGKPFLIL